MSSCDYSSWQPNMTPQPQLTSSRSYINGCPLRATVDTTPSRRRTTTPCHLHMPLLHMLRPLTDSIPVQSQRKRFCKTIPLDYASHLIQTNQIEKSVETLERGRAFLWSEMRGLRSSIDQITLVGPHLADEFATVNREFETLAFAFPTNDDAFGDGEGMDSFHQLVVRQRKLLDDRAKLIARIQALPGFDTFLKPPAFDCLRSAASHGPLIIINHSDWRSDIIILLHNSPPSKSQHFIASVPARLNCKIDYCGHERMALSRMNTRALYVPYCLPDISLWTCTYPHISHPSTHRIPQAFDPSRRPSG
jgi:hypothetical protein